MKASRENKSWGFYQYARQMAEVRTPWFSIYGECDEVVPVEASMDILQRLLKSGDNHAIEVCVVPDADHMYRIRQTGERLPFDKLIVGWILRHWDIIPSEKTDVTT